MGDGQMLSHQWNLPGLRASTYPTPSDLEARRHAGRAVEPVSPTADVEVRQEQRAGVPCVICQPRESSGTALYFHGGGYRLGSAALSTTFAAWVASTSKVTVVVVDYRLAPEQPFPAGLTDAAAVYQAALDHDSAVPLVIGDSAGGGLAAALTVAAAGAGLPLPRAVVLMSPWLDLSCTAETFALNAATDQLFSLASAREAAAMYLQGHDATDPLVSPLRSDIGRWPPTLLMASTDEVLLQDSITFVSLLTLAGTDLTCTFAPGVPHAWPAVFPDLPASKKARSNIARFTTTLLADQRT